MVQSHATSSASMLHIMINGTVSDDTIAAAAAYPTRQSSARLAAAAIVYAVNATTAR
jgi:hypothetical protein